MTATIRTMKNNSCEICRHLGKKQFQMLANMKIGVVGCSGTGSIDN